MSFVPFVPLRLLCTQTPPRSIPGTALHEGINWGWETYPEFLDHLDGIRAVMDFGSQLGHAAVRSFVLGERAVDPGVEVSDAEMQAMADVVQEAIEAGAVGFSSTFAEIHQDIHGNNVPGCWCSEDEMMALAKAMGRAGRAVYESAGAPNTRAMKDGGVTNNLRFLEEVGRETVVSLLVSEAGIERQTAWLEKCHANGSEVWGQVFARAQGLLLGLDGVLNVFSIRSKTYREYRNLKPLAARVARLQDPGVRAAIFSEYDSYSATNSGPDVDQLTLKVSENFANMWIMDAHEIDYEPTEETSIAALASAQGKRPQELLLDALLMDAGKGVVWYPYQHGYSERNYDNVRAGLIHPCCVVGNADAGAHVAAFTDASCTTFMMSFWARDRTRGPQLPLEQVVKSQARDAARLYGFHDRGTIETGMKADINVIDFAQLRIHRPEVVHDLPSGASRWTQQASGYKLTMVAGVVTFRDGEPTGERPGKLIRNPYTAAKRAAGTCLKADLGMLRAMREAGRGGFDIQAGVDRSNFIAHMPGPISQAFYRAERQQQRTEMSASSSTSKL